MIVQTGDSTHTPCQYHAIVRPKVDLVNATDYEPRTSNSKGDARPRIERYEHGAASPGGGVAGPFFWTGNDHGSDRSMATPSEHEGKKESRAAPSER